MAKQQSGVNAVTVWMIVFAALWLAATVFLVILYTQQEDMRGEVARAQAAQSTLITSAQKQSLDLVKEAREGGPTVVGLLEEARSKTAELATGTPSDNVASVQTKLDQTLSRIRTDALVPQPKGFNGVSYHDALTRLYTAFKSEHDLRTSAEQRAKELEGEVARLAEADTARQNDFEQKTREAADKLAECESTRAEFREDRGKATERLEQELDETRRRSTEELNVERQARLAAESRLGELQERFAAQQEKLSGVTIGPEALSTARKPDGEILTAVPGDDVVYINLGAKDTLTLGLQFAVYSPDTGIPANGKGKAQLEVLSIFPTSAECRVVWKAPNAVLVEGDWVANPVYDPTRPPTFLVLGEFDLNQDGALDRDGRSAIEALIKNWGGKVADEVTPMTDFVVLGAPPRKPRSGGFSSGQDAYARYNENVSAAREMSIPVMTQNVFLSFLGYSGRQASR